MKYKLFIYYNDDKDNHIDSKEFNNPNEIEDMLEDYEGYWAKVIDLETSKAFLVGVFDDTFLDEDYYE